MNIDLHIEELVLHGFASGDRQAIAEAMRDELTQLFAEQGITQPPAGGAKLGRIDAGAFTIQANTGAGAIGSQIARNIHTGITSLAGPNP